MKTLDHILWFGSFSDTIDKLTTPLMNQQIRLMEEVMKSIYDVGPYHNHPLAMIFTKLEYSIWLRDYYTLLHDYSYYHRIDYLKANVVDKGAPDFYTSKYQTHMKARLKAVYPELTFLRVIPEDRDWWPMRDEKISIEVEPISGIGIIKYLNQDGKRLTHNELLDLLL